MGGSNCCCFLDAYSDHRCPYSKQWCKSCWNLNCMLGMTIKSSSCLNRINKLNNCDYFYWQFLSLVCPLKYQVTLFLQRLPLTRAFEGFFLSVQTWVFVDVNQLFPWFSAHSDREGSLIVEWRANNFERRRLFKLFY